MTIDPLLLDMTQAAARLGVTRRWLADHYRRHGIPAVRLGHRTLRFRPADLERWASRRRSA
jgi:excisionase family DNA binding protein